MIVVDIETTGMDPHADSILSIGALDFNNSENTFYGECRIWDGAHVNNDALKVNGFSLEEITDKSKQTEAELILNFLDWVRGTDDHTLAGHNPHFDFSFLQAGARRAKLDFWLAYRVVDLHTVCYYHLLKRGLAIPLNKKRSDINSDFVMKYVGIPTEPKPHIAKNGVKYETEAFYRLFYDKPLFEEFKKYPVSWVK